MIQIQIIYLIKLYTLKLTYEGDHNINLMKSIKTSTKKKLPAKHDLRIILRQQT